MKRQLTLQEYRTIDLILFALMLGIFEFIIVKVAGHSFYTVSLAAAITAIVYMRWGWWGAIHAALAGMLFCVYHSGAAQVTLRQYMTYTLGNLVSVAAVPALKRLGPQRVRDGVLSSLAFGLGVILLMQGGRAGTALLLGETPQGALTFFTADALSVLFTLVIVWIVRRLDGVFEDQKHYLTRIQEEEERNNTEQ